MLRAQFFLARWYMARACGFSNVLNILTQTINTDDAEWGKGEKNWHLKSICTYLRTKKNCFFWEYFQKYFGSNQIINFNQIQPESH